MNKYGRSFFKVFERTLADDFTTTPTEMSPIKEDFKYRLKIIGDNLKASRVSRMESVQAVSSAMEISEAQLEEIENGQCDMDLGLLIDLCYHYNVKPADVISADFNNSSE